ncbi:MAG: FAD-binding oxidoreductase [Deinococcales bacterium]
MQEHARTATDSRPPRAAAFPDTAVSLLRESLRGQLLTPGDDGYEEARSVYNAMIQRHPAAIARVADVADVITCVNTARDGNLTLAVRGGGHNAAGLGIVDAGHVVDLGNLTGLRVDAQARTVRVEAGCLWGDVDHATHPFGLAVPCGFIASTGVAGLTLGGGSGYLTRSCGLTIDNLLAADVVLADGSYVTASADEHPDLFWALRGGGGNFGIVTSFLFRAHPVKNVIGGPTMWALDKAEDALRGFQDLIESAPEELGGFFAFTAVPPVPPFPEELHGRTVAAVVWCHNGSQETFDDIVGPLVAPDATAYRHRDAMWSQVIVGVDPDPANAGKLRDWAVTYHDALHPHSTGAAYVNFMMDEGQDRIEATYGDNYDRLRQIKRRYDPDNLFHVNQNIPPAG